MDEEGKCASGVGTRRGARPLAQLSQVKANLVVNEPQLSGVRLEGGFSQVGMEGIQGLLLVGKQVGLQPAQLAQAEIHG